MKRISISIFSSVVVVSAIALNDAKAQALTGGDLYQLCQGKIESVAGVACLSYVSGYLDGFILGHWLGMNHPDAYCPPKGGIPMEQARLIVEKFLRDHPEKLHIQAGVLAADALVAAFPCVPKLN